jgi:DHA2 family multidrug resistance protein
MIMGIPPQVFAALPPGPLDVATQVLLAPLLEKAALTAAINDAWLLIAVLTGIALLFLPFARRSVTAPEKHL